MLRIRLLRMGRRHRPFYRIVVVNSRRKRDTGSYIAVLGTYDPLAQKGKKLKFDKGAYEEWVRKGAQPSEAVLKLVLPVEEKKKIWPDKPKEFAKAKEAGDSDEGGSSEVQEGEGSAEGSK